MDTLNCVVTPARVFGVLYSSVNGTNGVESEAPSTSSGNSDGSSGPVVNGNGESTPTRQIASPKATSTLNPADRDVASTTGKSHCFYPLPYCLMFAPHRHQNCRKGGMVTVAQATSQHLYQYTIVDKLLARGRLIQ